MRKILIEQILAQFSSVQSRVGLDLPRPMISAAYGFVWYAEKSFWLSLLHRIPIGTSFFFFFVDGRLSCCWPALVLQSHVPASNNIENKGEETFRVFPH